MVELGGERLNDGGNTLKPFRRGMVTHERMAEMTHRMPG